MDKGHKYSKKVSEQKGFLEIGVDKALAVDYRVVSFLSAETNGTND